MSITKRALVDLAFSELGMGKYNYDLQPEDVQLGVEKLDDLMAEWDGYGIQTGYPLNTVSNAQTVDDPINLILQLKSGVASALAVALAPDYGKTPSPQTVMNATKGKKNGLRLSASPPHKRLNTTMTPAGAGYKRHNWPRNLADEGPHYVNPDETGYST